MGNKERSISCAHPRPWLEQMSSSRARLSYKTGTIVFIAVVLALLSLKCFGPMIGDDVGDTTVFDWYNVSALLSMSNI